MDEIKDFLISFIFILMGALFFVFVAKVVVTIDKQEDKKKEMYELETYYDEDTGINMLIFKDKLGDVLYCEPVEVEMEER